MHSLTLSVLRFICKIFFKLLKLTLQKTFFLGWFWKKFIYYYIYSNKKMYYYKILRAAKQSELKRCSKWYRRNHTKHCKLMKHCKLFVFKGCVCYIFASLFCRSKREHLWNLEKNLFHFKSSFRSWENRISCHQMPKHKTRNTFCWITWEVSKVW